MLEDAKVFDRGLLSTLAANHTWSTLWRYSTI